MLHLVVWKKLTDVLEITAPIIRVMIETATPLKRRSTCTRLQGATFQKVAIFMVAMIISNLTNFEQTFIEFLISDVYLNLSPKFNFNLCRVTYLHGSWSVLLRGGGGAHSTTSVAPQPYK
jgi:hypothetical protein